MIHWGKKEKKMKNDRFGLKVECFKINDNFKVFGLRFHILRVFQRNMEYELIIFSSYDECESVISNFHQIYFFYRIILFNLLVSEAKMKTWYDSAILRKSFKFFTKSTPFHFLLNFSKHAWLPFLKTFTSFLK